MPIIHEAMSSGKTVKRVDVLTLAATLKLYPLDLIVIEQVSARPGQGAVSTFSFGHTAGAIGAVAALTGAEIQTVRPATWKRAMGLTAEKDCSRDRAIELSGQAEHFKLKRHHDRAEAYLLAIWGMNSTTITEGESSTNYQEVVKHNDE
ncbi:hypothetical protein FF100_22165 [Methylobacterium terricola]|uniref:Uncharacterized protein n=1 Tax=Methylobacterium terricola TaxID=2583531 RepID=A0A5C4LE58_9HYPH|nr:hypothetical protein [Methylobacterium terricola]TNC10859.1 hypothetical protein FF100_22165 [Methylobacterium terricola]